MKKHEISPVNNNSGTSISLWMEEQIESPPALHKDLDADVCIVGSGIVGLTCAYLLGKQGKSVVVLETGSIAGGQTARTTGHLTWILDDRFEDLEKYFGEEGSKMAGESHKEAVNLIEKIVKHEKIDCDFKRVDAYLFKPPEESFEEELEKEFTAIKRAGIEVYKVKKAPFNDFDTGPCLRFPHQGKFHILKYLKGLIVAIEKMGGKIYCHTHVSHFEDDTPCKVKTDKGHEVTCQAVVVATCTPINDRFIIHSKQAAYRTYVIAAPIEKGLVEDALYWDNLDPYHYIRLQKYTEHKDWLIVGGEDHKTGQDKEMFERYVDLESWAKDRFPQMGKIEYKWSGQVFEPFDSLAYIGKNPLNENIYIATGDSGNGLTHGTLAGILLTDLIMEKENRWADLYNPSRKTFRAGTEYLKENLNVAEQYTDWISPGEVKGSENIAKGSGAILRDGLTKLAVYRDEKGKLHQFSAVCPHLGCIVQWNSEERSWDCPCHGSRFNCCGKVITGPANENLKEKNNEDRR